MSTDPEHLVENAQERLGFGPEDNKGTEMYGRDGGRPYAPAPEDADEQQYESFRDPRQLTGNPYPYDSNGEGTLSRFVGGPREQGLGPTNEAIPVGDQLTAQARDKLYKHVNMIDVLKERKRALEGWLMQTGNAEVDPDTKELVIHMQGSQEPVTYERGGEPDEIDPETVRNAITDLDAQISQQPDEMRRYQNWQAARDVRRDPSLLDEQRHNDAANNASDPDWMNAAPYRQRLQGTDLETTIRNVYNAMSGWQNRAETDANRLAPRAIKQQSADINEQMKGYHKWWNSGAEGIEDPNDPELLANQYSSRALEEGDYVPEDHTRGDSSGTMAAGKHALNVMQGGKVTASVGDDRITFPQLLAKAPQQEGMYAGKEYLNQSRYPGGPTTGEIDKLQKEDMLLRRDDLARQNAPDIVAKIEPTQSWAQSVDAKVENLLHNPIDTDYGKLSAKGQGKEDKDVYSYSVLQPAMEEGQLRPPDAPPSFDRAEDDIREYITPEMLQQLAGYGREKGAFDPSRPIMNPANQMYLNWILKRVRDQGAAF